MAIRSISLPSRLHPTSLIKVEANLDKLKKLEQESLSITSLQTRLIGLAELYISFTNLIRSPSTQQSLLDYDQGKLVQDALAASVALITTCSVSRDVVSSIKDHVRGIQSAMRRRSGVESHAGAYVAFRKKSKKEVAECVKEMKRLESTSSDEFAPLLDQSDFYLGLVVRLFRAVASVSITTFRSLLLLLSAPSRSGSRWSVIARVVAKQSSRKEVVGEVASVDAAILSMKSGKGVEMEELRVMDCGSEDLEGALDTVFRRLVQNRVSLLNILTH